MAPLRWCVRLPILLHVLLQESAALSLGIDAAASESIVGAVRYWRSECTPIKSGSLVSLESNLHKDHYVTVTKASSRGRIRWGNLHHVTGGPLKLMRIASLAPASRLPNRKDVPAHLLRIRTDNGTPLRYGAPFSIEVPSQGRMYLDTSVGWPPLVSLGGAKDMAIHNASDVEEADLARFEAVKAHTVSFGANNNLLTLVQMIPFLKGSHPVHENTGEGNIVCQGDSIFIRHRDPYTPLFRKEGKDFMSEHTMRKLHQAFGNECDITIGNCRLGDWYYFQGNDNHKVGFWHHYPGFSGKRDDLNVNPMRWVADDVNATANRFTIRAETPADLKT